MSETRDGFLSRWSRLKRESVSTPRSEQVSPDSVSAPEEEVLPEGKALEELIAELPRIEDLVPGQNLAVFMQEWVPSTLRNAALQRMWLLDPAIRDYVGPALDYAHDYNTPGATPGFGPMEASEEAVREVAEMFDRAVLRGRPDEACGGIGACDDNLSQVAAGEPGATAAVQRERIIPKSFDTAENRPPSASPTGNAEVDAVQPGRVSPASHNISTDEVPQRPSGRRHGGALPG